MIKKAKNFIKKNLPLWYLNQPGIIFGFNKRKLRALKNRFTGQRCFILGNGPSLNKMDLSLLDGESSFAVNGIFYKTDETGYKPTFFIVEDGAVMKDNRERINNFKCDYNFFPSIYKKDIKNRENTYFFNMDRSFYESRSSYFEIPRFSVDASDRLYCGQSVTIINLQMAYYLGFSEVYLIGMDFNYDIPDSLKIDGHVFESTEDDTNHFHPDYFGKGKKWHDPKLHNVMKSYKMAKLIFEIDDRKIYNATAGGKLDIFDRVDYNTLF